MLKIELSVSDLSNQTMEELSNREILSWMLNFENKNNLNFRAKLIHMNMRRSVDLIKFRSRENPFVKTIATSLLR